MSVLILSTPEDVHALAVCWGLRRLGVKCEVLYLSDIPQLATLILKRFESGTEVIEFASAELNLCLNDFETVWFRRVPRPIVPTSIHPDDQKQAILDWASLSDSIGRILHLAGKRVINSNWRAAQLKPWQLACASRAGLLISETIITNNYSDGIEFISKLKHSGDQAIFKSITHAIWDEPGKARILFTTKITESDLNSQNIRHSPIIIQKFCDKAYDVRVVSFGSKHIGVRIDSQKDADSNVDFRLKRNYEDLDHLVIEVPSVVAEGLDRLNRLLGIEISASDFMLTSDGNWHFLESNPTGGFLWMEESNSDINLLDPCCRFLANDSNSLDNDIIKYGEFSKEFDRNAWQLHLLSHIPCEVFIPSTKAEE